MADVAEKFMLMAERAFKQRDEAVKALEKLSLAYVNLLEIGRDRIIALGGTCDPVDVMEAGDPSLRAARDVLGRVKSTGEPR